MRLPGIVLSVDVLGREVEVTSAIDGPGTVVVFATAASAGDGARDPALSAGDRNPRGPKRARAAIRCRESEEYLSAGRPTRSVNHPDSQTTLDWSIDVLAEDAVGERSLGAHRPYTDRYAN